MNNKNKKILAMLLSLVMLFSALSYAVSAETGSSEIEPLADGDNENQSNLFTLSASQSSDYSSVTVSISASGISAFTGATFIVEYDSAIITLAENGVEFASNLSTTYGSEAGSVNCAFMSTDAINLNSPYLVRLTFNAIKSGDAKLNLKITSAVSEDKLLADADIIVTNEILNVYIPEPTTEPPTNETTTKPVPTTQKPVPTTTPKEQDNTPSLLILIDANSADVDNVAKKVKKIPAETEVSDFLALFENKNLVVKDRDGKLINSSDIVGTGSTVELYKNGGVSTGVIYYIAVLGDANGDGSVKTNDARLTLRAAVSIEILEGVYFDAVNLGGGEKIKTSDARKILRVAVKIDPKL